jgi:hypothetical protein
MKKNLWTHYTIAFLKLIGSGKNLEAQKVGSWILTMNKTAAYNSFASCGQT